MFVLCVCVYYYVNCCNAAQYLAHCLICAEANVQLLFLPCVVPGFILMPSNVVVCDIIPHLVRRESIKYRCIFYVFDCLLIKLIRSFV